VVKGWNEMVLNGEKCAVRHRIWVEKINTSNIPSRPGQNLLAQIDFYPYLILDGIDNQFDRQILC